MNNLEQQCKILQRHFEKELDYHLNSNRKKFIVSFNIGTHGSYKQEFNKEWLLTIGVGTVLIIIFI